MTIHTLIFLLISLKIVTYTPSLYSASGKCPPPFVNEYLCENDPSKQGMPNAKWFENRVGKRILALDLDATIWINPRDHYMKHLTERLSEDAIVTIPLGNTYNFIDVPFYKKLFKICTDYEIEVVFLTHGWSRPSVLEHYFKYIIKNTEINWTIIGNDNLKILAKTLRLDLTHFTTCSSGVHYPLKWKVLDIFAKKFKMESLLIDNGSSVHERLLKAQSDGECSAWVTSLWNKGDAVFEEANRCGVENLLAFLNDQKVPAEKALDLVKTCPFARTFWE